MRRNELVDLTAFITVAEHLSFRAAALRLGVTPAALSHTIRQMEERLGVRLFNRTTRRFALTDAGQGLLHEVRPARDRISGAIEHLNDERARPAGHPRVHTNDLGALAVIAPAWSRFVTAYPDVQLELGVDEGRIDIVVRGFDAGISLREGVPADMFTVRVSGPIRGSWSALRHTWRFAGRRVHQTTSSATAVSSFVATTSGNYRNGRSRVRQSVD
jgi:DNA-binding transcriptional LysR family regulator